MTYEYHFINATSLSDLRKKVNEAGEFNWEPFQIDRLPGYEFTAHIRRAKPDAGPS